MLLASRIRLKSCWPKLLKVKLNKDVLSIFLLLFLTFVVYLKLFNVPFLYDDFDFLFNWDTIRDFKNIPLLLYGDLPVNHEGVYRPLRSIFYVMSLKMLGHNLFFYHFQELIVYFSSIALVYFITQNLIFNRFVSFVTALLFALSGLHIDNVANLTSNFDLIGSVFFFLSFYFFQKYTLASVKHNKYFLIISAAASFVAYFTYEITLVMPFIILVYAFYTRRKFPFAVYAVFVLPVLIYLIIRNGLLDTPLRGNVNEYLFYKLAYIIQELLGLFVSGFVPIISKAPSLSSVYASFEFSKAEGYVFFGDTLNMEALMFSLLMLAGILMFSVVSFKKRQVSGFGLVWFFISCLPVIAIALQSSQIGLHAQPINPRYAFIATFGTSLFLANIFNNVLTCNFRNSIAQYFRITFVCLMLVFLLIQAIVIGYNLDNWRDPRPGFIAQIKKFSESNADMHNDLGVVYASEKKMGKAMSEFQLAIIAQSDHAKAKRNILRLCRIADLDLKADKECKGIRTELKKGY